MARDPILCLGLALVFAVLLSTVGNLPDPIAGLMLVAAVILFVLGIVGIVRGRPGA